MHNNNLKFSNKDFSTVRQKLFWLFQFIFWFVHWIVSILINPEYAQKFLQLIDLTLTVFMGCCISLFIRYIYNKYNIHKKSLPNLSITSLSISVLAGLIFVYGGILISFILSGFKDFYQIKNISSFIRFLWLNTYPFIAWSALYLGYKIWEEWNFQRLEAEKEHTLAQTAQIEMLRYQLNPHFLFNTLSSLRALIRIDSNKAEDIVTRISEILRYSLSYENENNVLLYKEIEIIRNYFEIEKIRFGNNLLVEYKIDNLANNYPIPIFLIHPLIENAVKHGMQTSSKPLKINLTVAKTENGLLIEVSNSGIWIENNESKNSTGKGLANIKKRLEFYYPNNHQFIIIKNPDSVSIKIILNSIQSGKNDKTIQSAYC
jgi:two-component system, LytTR family, sensor kinase